MRAENPLAANWPARKESVQPTLRIYQQGDRVRTGSGEIPVERLRPGDRLVSENVQSAKAVLWVEMRRMAGSGAVRVQVVLGHNTPKQTGANALPVVGKISRYTGKLERIRDHAAAQEAVNRVH